jgi:hypothetical protein
MAHMKLAEAREERLVVLEMAEPNISLVLVTLHFS